MRALISLALLVALAGCAWGICRQADWQQTLDQSNVWAACKDNEYIRGFWRHNPKANDERLGRIEYANCCPAGENFEDGPGVCREADWGLLLDRYGFLWFYGLLWFLWLWFFYGRGELAVVLRRRKLTLSQGGLRYGAGVLKNFSDAQCDHWQGLHYTFS